MLACLQCLSQELVSLCFGDQFLWLLLVTNVRVIALFYRFGKLLYFFDLLLVQVVDLLDDLEGSVALAIDFEGLVPIILASLLVNFHAIVGSFGAFHVEVDLAVLLEAFDCGAHIDALLSANDAANTEFLEVKAVHLHRRLWRNLWTLRPHRTTMMHPVVQRICDWRLRQFQLGLVPLNEMAVVFWNAVIVALVIVEVELELLLLFHDLLVGMQLRGAFLVERFFLDGARGVVFVLFLVELHVDLLVVIEFTLQYFCQAAIVFETLRDLLLVNVVWLYVVFTLTLLSLELLLRYALHLTLLLGKVLQLLDLTLAGLFGEYLYLLIVVFVVAPEDVGWLHGAASLWAQEALDHEAALEPKCKAIVAYPVYVWNVLQAKA